MVRDTPSLHSSSASKALFCPVTGLPVHTRREWLQQHIGPAYHASLSIVGRSILHSAPTGTIGDEEMASGLHLTMQVADHIDTRDGRYVLIEDLDGLASATLKARKEYLRISLQNDRLMALIFCNASSMMKVGIKIGQRFNTSGIKIHIAENYADAVALAVQYCTAKRMDCGPLCFDPIPGLNSDHKTLVPVELLSHDGWCVEYDHYSNRCVLIDRTILYSKSVGFLKPENIGAVNRLRLDVRRATPQGATLEYIILNSKQFEGSNRVGRKQYMQNLRDWCRRYPLKMYIIVGANTFMRTAWIMAKPFMPFKMAMASDINKAFELVARDRRNGHLKGRKSAAGADRRKADQSEIDKMLSYIGGIDWENTGISHDMPFENDHPLYPVAQAIQLIKGELDDLFQERETAQRARRITEQKYRELFEKGSDWLLVHDLEGNIIETNFNFKDELDWVTTNTNHPNVKDLAPKRFHSEVDAYLANVSQKGHSKGIFSVSAKNNREVILEYYSVLISDNKGELTWVKSSARDITFEIMAAREKKQLEKKLQQSQKMESIGTLAGGIAHDFNNILSSVIGFSELALDDVEKGTLLEDNLQEVIKAGYRAKNLVRQILTFARRSDEKCHPIQVRLIAREVLKLLRSTLPANIEIRDRIESSAMIMGNPTQVHQILMNLCTNAAHAMEDNGGFLEIRLEEVEIEPRKSGRFHDLDPGTYIQLTVSDTGPGISSDIIDAIFEPYFTTKSPYHGTGMGLSIVHGIVKSYNGEVYVSSKQGSGAEFKVMLPVTADSSISPPNLDATLPTGNERILFVDDEFPVLKVGCRILNSLGYTVTALASSTEALSLFESNPGEFDLVITDMTMPKITGDRLARKMLKIRPDLPIIMCTGFNKLMSEQRAGEIGIKALVNKPIVKSDLADTIRKALG